MDNNRKSFVVCLHGTSRNHNYGDVLLMSIYKSWIEEAGGKVIMDMANTYYGETLNVRSSIPIKEAVDKADFIVYGGGGYFGEPRNPSLRWRAKFVLHHMMPGILARLKGKPYAFFGFGYGPLDNWVIRKIGMFVLNGAEVVCVRDNRSREYLLKYGFKGKVVVKPDSALTIAKDNHSFFQKNTTKKRKKIALHLPLGKGFKYEELRKSLINFIEKLKLKLDADFYFLVDHGVDTDSNQYLFFKDLNIDFPIKRYYDPTDTLSFINTCDVVITSKLHVAITSYALGVKPIGISKHPKTERFFKQVDLTECHFDVMSLLEHDLSDSIISIINKNSPLEIDEDIIKSSLETKNLLLNFLN